jgi:hypothetical protein
VATPRKAASLGQIVKGCKDAADGIDIFNRVDQLGIFSCQLSHFEVIQPFPIGWVAIDAARRTDADI